jgi:hypothetical protein
MKIQKLYEEKPVINKMLLGRKTGSWFGICVVCGGFGLVCWFRWFFD